MALAMWWNPMSEPKPVTEEDIEAAVDNNKDPTALYRLARRLLAERNEALDLLKLGYAVTEAQKDENAALRQERDDLQQRYNDIEEHAAAATKSVSDLIEQRDAWPQATEEFLDWVRSEARDCGCSARIEAAIRKGTPNGPQSS